MWQSLAEARGLAAGLYGARSNLKVLIIERGSRQPDANTLDIENYPGFKHILGPDLCPHAPANR